MPQICPSSSHQLAAAAVAFRRARAKFPKNLGSCVCSGDAVRTPPQAHPAAVKDADPPADNVIIESKPDYNPITDRSCGSNLQARGNHAWYPSLSSSRTAVWSSNCHNGRRGRIIEGSNGVARPELLCAVCGKRHNCGHATRNQVYKADVEDSSKTSTVASRRVCTKVKATESRESMNMTKPIISDQESFQSAYSSAGRKKRKHVRHRRACIHAGRMKSTGSRSPPKTQGASHICHLHGYPDYDLKASIKGNGRPKEDGEKVDCSDSPTVADFPTKLQTWEHRTQRGIYERAEHTMSRRGAMGYRQDQHDCKSRYHQNEQRRSNPRKTRETDSKADVCLRPSLIKAAQRKVDLESRNGSRSYRDYGVGSRLSKHSDSKSTWDENLNILNHKDSMSIIMDRFKSNDKHHTLKLQNIYELNSVLGSKTSCGEGEAEKLRGTTDSATNQSLDEVESTETHFPARKSFSGVNATKKLGRVANQALRENESHFKNLRTRLNRSGICCSPKGTPWRRAF